jgi:hypothetical protein
VRVPQQMSYVALSAGEVVVDAQDIMPFVHEPFTEVRAEKPGPACHQNSSHNRAPIHES